jgi:hypothetical protein
MDLTEEEITLIKELAYNQFSLEEIAIVLEKNTIEFEHEFNLRSELWRMIEGQRLKAKKEIRDKIFALAKAGDPEMIMQAQRLIVAQKLKSDD